MSIHYLKIITLTAASLLAVNIQSATAASVDREPAEARSEISYHHSNRQGREQLQFDVAESGPRFVFDEAPILESGLPAYGNSFVTQGFIYPHGTLDGTNGVFADGSPEFPDKVIGEWTCRGFFIRANGEAEQMLLGFNVSEGVNLRFDISVK